MFGASPSAERSSGTQRPGPGQTFRRSRPPRCPAHPSHAAGWPAPGTTACPLGGRPGGGKKRSEQKDPPSRAAPARTGGKEGGGE